MGYQLLEKPYTRKQIESIQNTAGEISGTISVDLIEIVNNDFKGLIKIFQKKLIGEGILSDIHYMVVGTGIHSEIHIYISGEVKLF